jgi:hypothetical protein
VSSRPRAAGRPPSAAARPDRHWVERTKTAAAARPARGVGSPRRSPPAARRDEPDGGPIDDAGGVRATPSAKSTPPTPGTCRTRTRARQADDDRTTTAITMYRDALLTSQCRRTSMCSGTNAPSQAVNPLGAPARRRSDLPPACERIRPGPRRSRPRKLATERASPNRMTARTAAARTSGAPERSAAAHAGHLPAELDGAGRRRGRPSPSGTAGRITSGHRCTASQLTQPTARAGMRSAHPSNEWTQSS